MDFGDWAKVGGFGHGRNGLLYGVIITEFERVWLQSDILVL